MAVYNARKHAESYGHAVGILVLDIECPYIPGDVGNASTFGFPVIYRRVRGCDVERVLFAPDPKDRDEVIQAARDLEGRGVRAITSNCGFLIRYQQAAAASVRVPVLLSSLLQVPMILRAVGESRPIGVIAAHSQALSAEMLSLAGIASDAPIVIGGMEDQPGFRSSMLTFESGIDPDQVERETVEVARSLQADQPDLGAILLECAVLPPYARAVQQATGLPVYDFVTMINYFHAANHRQSFDGHF